MATVWNPMRDLMQGYQFMEGVQTRREDRDHLRQQRQQEALLSEQRQMAALIDELSIDPSTGQYIDDWAARPGNLDKVSTALAQMPHLNRMLTSGTGRDGEVTRLTLGPDGRVVPIVRRDDLGTTGPATVNQTNGPDDIVESYEPTEFGLSLREAVSMGLPEWGEQRRTRLQEASNRRYASELAGHLLPEAPDYTDRIVAAENELAGLEGRRLGLEQAMQMPPPAPTAPAALNRPLPEDPAQLAPALAEISQRIGSTQERIVKLEDALKRAGVAEEPRRVGSEPNQMANNRVRRDLAQARHDLSQLEQVQAHLHRTARGEVATATPLAEAPAGAPLRDELPAGPDLTGRVEQTQAQIRETNAALARLREAERAGKTTAAVRETLMEGIESGAFTLDDVKAIAEMSRSPEIKMQVNAGGHVEVLDTQGNLVRRIEKTPEPESPADARAAASANLNTQRFRRDTIQQVADGRFDKRKRSNDYNWLIGAMGVALDQGYLVPPEQDSAAFMAQVDKAVEAIDGDKKGWLWFGNKGYRDYPSLSIPLLARGLSSGTDIRKVVEDLTPSKAVLDAVAREGGSKEQLIVEMANAAQRLAGAGASPEQAIAYVRQQTEAQYRQ